MTDRFHCWQVRVAAYYGGRFRTRSPLRFFGGILIAVAANYSVLVAVHEGGHAAAAIITGHPIHGIVLPSFLPRPPDKFLGLQWSPTAGDATAAILLEHPNRPLTRPEMRRYMVIIGAGPAAGVICLLLGRHALRRHWVRNPTARWSLALTLYGLALITTWNLLPLCSPDGGSTDGYKLVELLAQLTAP